VKNVSEALHRAITPNLSSRYCGYIGMF